MKSYEPPAVVESKFTIDQHLRSEKFARSVKELESKYVTPERMVRIALNALNRNPDIANCTWTSVFSALMRLTEIGLEPDGYHAHLIPYNNKIKGSSPAKYRKEAQLIIDYKGLVTVIRRNPAIAVVKGAVVYNHDKFVYREGSDRYFEHEPAWDEEDQKAGNAGIKGAYCFVKFANINDWEVDFLPKWKIDKARASSRASDSGPWVTNYDEQCIKTAIRHQSKTLPLTMEERRTMMLDDDTIDLEDNARRLPQRTAEFRANKKVVDIPGDPEPETESSEEEPLPEEREDRSSEPEKQEDPLSKPATDKDQSLAKLKTLMAKESISDTEVISVLSEHSLDTGEAAQSDLVEDLPIDTVKLASGKQWATFLFSINRKRKEAAAAK